MRAGAVALVAIALTGCGSEEAAETGGAPHGQRAVVDCGSYENPNRPPTSAEEEANECLIEALDARRPAKLVATLTTVEGDPIAHTFTVTEAGRVELVVDATKDAYGGGVQYYTCTGLSQSAGRLAWTGCTQADAPKESPQTNPQQPS